MDTEYKNKAQIFIHCLNMGVSSPGSIAAWAVEFSENHAEYPDWIQKLVHGTYQSVNEVQEVLKQVAGKTDKEVWWPLLKIELAQGLQQGLVPPQHVATYCYNLAVDDDIPAYDRVALYQFELEYACLFEGFAAQSEVDSNVLRFFSGE